MFTSHQRLLLFYSPHCVQFSESYLTTTCTKPRKSPVICTLQIGNHPTNYKRCTVYKVFQQRCQHLKSSKHAHVQQSTSKYLSHTINTLYTGTFSVTSNDTIQIETTDTPLADMYNSMPVDCFYELKYMTM